VEVALPKVWVERPLQAALYSRESFHFSVPASRVHHVRALPPTTGWQSRVLTGYATVWVECIMGCYGTSWTASAV
jgi:hypothetical protein